MRIFFWLFLISGLFQPLGVLAFERVYRSHIEQAQWQNEEKAQYYCRLQQQIPFYGKAVFTHRSGQSLQFQLFSEQPLDYHKSLQAIVMAEPAPWRHAQSFVICETQTPKGHEPLTIKGSNAWRMLMHLENGMMPSIQYRDQADQKDKIYIAISPMKFRSSLKKFKHCERSLLEYDPDEIMDFRIYFASNRAALNIRAKKMLGYVVKHLQIDKEIKQIRIDAHADDIGRRRFNDKLSQKRADTVVDYLVSLGVDKQMISAEAHGEREPAFDNKTPGGRAKNRRARIQLLHTPLVSKKEETDNNDNNEDYFPSDQQNTPIPNFINLEYLNK